ncbi:MAG: CDP-glycerol glycerophosphotransferase family protein, partial [Nanoarchaeota archaeon]|nr:CDP-glycerol glycerophosphotransferase family protein [Nanoarchaeota archaeon]
MILNYILNLSLIIGSYIVPKNKKLFLIGAANGKSFIGNSKYFYLYCLKNNKKIVWTTKSKKVYNMLKLKKMPVIKTKSLSGWWNALRANKIIITQGAIDFTYAHTLFGNFDIIQTWHGAPIKKVGFDCKINGFSDKIFRKLQQMQNKHWTLINTSKYVNKIHKKAFNPKKVLDLGHPRNDILFNKELKFDKIPKILELNNVNKVILYTPTYRKFDKNLKPFSEKFLRKLNNQLKKRKWIFL